MQYRDRHKLFPNKVIISYPFNTGGQLGDRRLWMAELNGEVLDYNRKDTLIHDATSKGYECVVLRIHRDGSASVAP